MARIISISRAKQQLLDLARRTQDLGESFILIKDSEPISALIPFDEYESLLETLDILEGEPDILAKLKKTEKEIAAGQFTVWEPAREYGKQRSNKRLRKGKAQT